MAAEVPTGVPGLEDVANRVIAKLEGRGGLGGPAGQMPPVVVNTPSPGGAVLQPAAPHPATSHPAPPTITPPAHGTTSSNPRDSSSGNAPPVSFQLAPPPTLTPPGGGGGGGSATAFSPAVQGIAARYPVFGDPIQLPAFAGSVHRIPPASFASSAPGLSSTRRLPGWRHAAAEGHATHEYAEMLNRGERFVGPRGLGSDVDQHIGGASFGEQHVGDFDFPDPMGWAWPTYSRWADRPTRASEMLRHSDEIKNGRATQDLLFSHRIFGEPVRVPKGSDVEASLLHADRVRIGQFQNFAAHATGLGHAFMSSSPSSQLGFLGSAAGAAGTYAMATGNVPLAVGAAAIGAGANVLSGSVDFTYQKLQEQARLERPRLQASAMGIDLGRDSELLRQSTQMGFGQAEATWLLKQYYGSIGSTRGGQAMNPLAAHLGGVDIGAMAFFQQGRGPGGGAAEADVNRSMSMAIGTGYQELGLRDTKLSEYLSRIAAATEGMKERGLTLNRESIVEFSSGLAAAGGKDNVFQGVRGLQVATQFSNQAIGVGQNLLAPFRELGDAALLSAAAREGGNAFDINERLQGWSKTPRLVYEKLRGAGLSEDAMKHYFASSGHTAEEAKLLARGIDPGKTTQMEEIKAFSGKGAVLGAQVAGLEQDVALALKDLPKALNALTDVIRKGDLRQLATGQGVGVTIAQASSATSGAFSGTLGLPAVPDSLVARADRAWHEQGIIAHWYGKLFGD